MLLRLSSKAGAFNRSGKPRNAPQWAKETEMNARRLAIVAIGVLFVVACFGLANARASVVTLSFDPNDLIDRYPANYNDSKTTQEDARRVHYTWGTNYYGTFNDYLQTGHSQPSDYNTYVAWRNSLTGPTDGIAVFNTWFIDGYNATTWGEKYLIKPGTTVTATTPTGSGWNINYVMDPYVGYNGTCVQFYTLESALRLRLNGADIGNFTVTADLFIDNNGNRIFDAGDEEAKAGDHIRMWAGNLNGDDAPFYRNDTQAIFFSGASYCTGAGQGGSGFEAALDMTAIPEPATILVWSLLGTAAAGFGMWRRRRAA
jgi:hypothetical protein